MPTTKFLYRILVTILSVMLVAAPALRAEAMASATAGDVRGTVTLAGSGDAVPGVVVRLVDIDSARIVAEGATGETGAVEFADVAFGTYHVAVAAPDGFIAVPSGLLTLSDAAPVVAVTATVVEATQAITGEGQVSAVIANGVTIAGKPVMVGPETVWTGPLNSLPAIQAALDDGKKVCAKYVGNADPLAANTLYAEICDDAGAGALFLLGVLGAGLAGYAASHTAGGGGRGVEVITQ